MKCGSIPLLFSADHLRLFLHQLQIGNLGSRFQNSRLNVYGVLTFRVVENESLFVYAHDEYLVALFKRTREYIFLVRAVFDGIKLVLVLFKVFAHIALCLVKCFAEPCGFALAAQLCHFFENIVA